MVWDSLTLTDVAAYWKKGNNPADQSGRSRCKPSDWYHEKLTADGTR